MNEQIEAIVEKCGEYMTSSRLSRPVMERLMGGLGDRYSEPWRRHHVVPHMGDVMQFIVENIDDVEEPRALLWAGAYHDSIYIPQIPSKGVNEELSGELSQRDLAPYLPNREIILVQEFIGGTVEHLAKRNTDMAKLIDGDLKILGAPRPEFEEYDENIGLEYEFYRTEHAESYRIERGKRLNAFLMQSIGSRIFMTDAGYELYEAQAQKNLGWIVEKYGLEPYVPDAS